MIETRIDVPGGHIACWISGQAGGAPLVLSHALGTTHHLWDPQMAAFNEHFRVIRYDTRGHGASSATPGDYSIAQLGMDVVHVLDALDVARAHVCGLSLGGLTAMWLGAHAPARVGRLVLANTAARINSAAHWQDRMNHVGEHGFATLAAASPPRWFTEPFRRAHPEVEAATCAMLSGGSRHGYAGCCAALRDADLRAELSQITAPTLVISGMFDPATTPDDARETCAGIPQARLRSLHAAHLSNLEAPDEFADAVVAFLTEAT